MKSDGNHSGNGLKEMVKPMVKLVKLNQKPSADSNSLRATGRTKVDHMEVYGYPSGSGLNGRLGQDVKPVKLGRKSLTGGKL